MLQRLTSLSRYLLLPILHLSSLACALQPYNISISDQSPMITYYPSRSTWASQGWNVSYTQSTWSNYTNETIGQGISSHTTTMTGATASIGWVGTGIWFSGTISGTGAVVSLKIDGSDEGNSWQATGLSYGWHNATLSLSGSGSLSLAGAIIEVGIGNDGATITNSTQASLYNNGNSINPQFDTSQGVWEAATLIGGGGGSVTDTYWRLDTHTPWSKLTINAPANTSFIILLGTVNYDHTNFAVWLAPSNINTGTPSNQTFNGLSPWIGTDQVIYYATVDPTASVSVTIEFLGASWQYLDVAEAIFMIGSGGTPDSVEGSSKNSKAGAIVGGVFGGIATLVIVGAVLFFFSRKRRGQQTTFSRVTAVPPGEADEQQPFDIDEQEVRMTPFYDDPSAAYAGAASGSPSSVYNTCGQPEHAPIESVGTESSNPSHNGRFQTPARLSLATLPPDHVDPSMSFGSRTGSSSANTMTGLLPSKRSPRPSRDSGVRQEEDAGRIDILPPSYDPLWARDRESESLTEDTTVVGAR